MRRPALVLAAALALAACGGDDGGGSATDDEADSSSTAPADGVTTTTGAPVPEDVAAAPSAGCEADLGGIGPGETQQTVSSGGRDRAYAQYVPSAHGGGTPVPLVVDYHGYSEGGEIHALHSALGPYGDEQGFVTITPDSGYEVPRWDVDLASEDVAMFGDLLDEVEADLCIDTNRVFVTGLSNGAFMTSSVACAHSDRIAAAAPVAGITDPEGCAFDRPVPVIAFHGTEDTFVAFDGGLGSSVADLPAPDGEGTLGDEATPEDAAEDVGPTIPEVAAAWAGRNGCETEAVEEQVADDVVLQAFGCPAGAESELYVVEGGGHTWPGSEFDDSIVDIVGHVTHNIDANELMWEFFQAHPLAG